MQTVHHFFGLISCFILALFFLFAKYKTRRAVPFSDTLGKPNAITIKLILQDWDSREKYIRWVNIGPSATFGTYSRIAGCLCFQPNWSRSFNPVSGTLFHKLARLLPAVLSANLCLPTGELPQKSRSELKVHNFFRAQPTRAIQSRASLMTELINISNEEAHPTYISLVDGVRLAPDYCLITR